MSRSITFGGQTALKPGGLSRVNANALTPIGLSATGIIHLLGEADGGQPGTQITIDDPALAKSLFRSGPLADAIRVAFNATGDPRIPGGAFRVVAYKTNTSTQSNIQLPGDEAGVSDTDAGASTTTVVNLTTGGLTIDAQKDRWMLVNGEKRRIVSNTATSLTVTPALSAAPVATDAVTILDSQVILTSKDYGSHTNQISVEVEPGTGTGFVVTLVFEDVEEQSEEIGGTSKLDFKYVGGPVVDGGLVSAATATAITVDMTTAPTLDQFAGMMLRFADGTQRLISGNSAADPSVIDLDATHSLTTTEQAAVVGVNANVINVTTATASIAGANGKATSLTTAVSPTADDLSVNFSALNLTTLRELVDYVNGNTNFEAVVPDGVNADTLLIDTFDFGDRNTTVDVRFDKGILPDTTGSFRADLQVLVDWINDFSTLVTAAKASVGTDEGSELPAYTGGVSGTLRDVPVFLNAGTRGISTNSSFQSGFDSLLLTRGNHIVPLISQDLTNEGNGSTATLASVGAQLLAHVKLAATTAKNEMGGYLGVSGTRTALIAQAAAENDADVHVTGQKFSFLDVDGNLKAMDEWGSALSAASMRSGALEVGEPLSFKKIATSVVSQDSSWDPANKTDANKLIEAGVLFAEKVPSGVRWVRDLTTHIKDDNIAFMEGSTRDAVRFIAYDLRTHLEDRFTGTKAKPATAASIREATAAKMSEYLSDSIIVESLDPETLSKTLPGFRKLRVFINGNAATIRVEIFPVVGVAFTLNDIYLQLPRSAA